jgi:hypothetical protein
VAATCSAVSGVWLVSSMRSTNMPPVWRAKAQAYRAVRTSLTCSGALAEGANRTRGGWAG